MSDDVYPFDDDPKEGFIIPSSGGLGDMLADKLLCLRPMGTVEYESGQGKPRQATECWVIEVMTDDGAGKSYVDLGRQPIPWDHPRQELAKANPEAPWVMGTLVKRSVAWFLNPPRPGDVRACREAVRDFVADMRASRS